MPLEPVAMGIDDPRQHQIARKIDRAADRIRHDPPLGQRQARGHQPGPGIEHLGADQIERQGAHRSPSAASPQSSSGQGSSTVPKTESIHEMSGSKRPVSMKCTASAITRGLFIMKVCVTGSRI